MKLRISTPSRLHFGIIDMRGDLGRIHGSIGVSIKKPRLVLEIKESKTTIINGARSNRAREIVETLYNAYDIQSGVEITIHEDIPEHSGFGSGTQLSYAIGMGLNRIFNLGLTVEDIAVRLERSRVSGIGTYGFQKGGFILDGGHAVGERDKVPPLIYHQDFPEDWKFVLCLPKIHKGFSGEQEQKAFKKLEPPPAETVKSVSHIVLLKMIPALIEKNIEDFGDAMTSLDTIFGDYWKKIQGGTYSHPRIGECVHHLLECGAYGAGQSSWGPAIYGLADGDKHAQELEAEMNNYLNKGNNEGYVFTTSTDNLGAVITEEKT
jgi:beta-ribofuranosylaminobenzene 5'-phosphate synthase